MTARLIALVMLPVTVMCGLAGSIVLSSHTSAGDVMAVDRGVAELSELVILRDALSVIEASAKFDDGVAKLGIDRSVATSTLGFDWRDQLVAIRARADGAIAALGSRSPVREPAMQSFDADVNGGKNPTASIQRIGELRAASDRSVADALASLRARTSNPALRADLASLPIAIGMAELARIQGTDLAAVWFPAVGATPLETSSVLAELGTVSTEYAEATEDLRDLGVTSVVAVLTRIKADRQVQRFQRAVVGNLVPLASGGTALGQAVAASLGAGTTATTPLDIASLAATYRGYFARDELLRDLVTVAVAAARDDAQHLAAVERRTYVMGTLASAALALSTVAIALWLGRSISRPLKDLARFAHEVNDGHLDAAPSANRRSGPRETLVALGAFTDLVAILQLLDAKANALATCDFDDPALTRPLAGRIGRSLESSVTLLSGSIVERDKLQTNLAHQATHDALTGIANRPAALTAIQAAMDRAARTGATTALLFFDLNGFKAVNDSHGHEAGDDVLRQVASRLTHGLRIGDFAARLGGDEFVVVAEGIVDVADATDLAQRLLDAISDPIKIGRMRVSIGAAVGIAICLDGPEEPLSLLGRADAAMYRAKHQERSAIEVFDAELQRQLVEREDIRGALSDALTDAAGGGLALHYQPVLDAASGALVGVEALVRWDRGDEGWLVPDAFIPIAERTDLVIELDCWVLAEATRQLVAWSSISELATLPVAVNISGRHLLSRRLPDHIRAVLDRTGIAPDRLSIEVTETVLLGDLVMAAAELDAVRAMGVTVAIDDFGTGYTSLAHLQQLPIDTIKIDRSFISQLDKRRGSSLVRMVTDLGHAIDVKIVAEGVESDDELRALQAMGADHLQGFLLCRPLAPDALAAWAQDRDAVPHEAPLPAA